LQDSSSDKQMSSDSQNHWSLGQRCDGNVEKLKKVFI
jgi:hypothetical protein